MEAKAQGRFVRVTPQKARRVVNEIRGKSYRDADDLLKYAPQSVARDVRKILNSAVANYRQACEQYGENFNESDIYVRETYVDEGPTMKRFIAKAQGRAGRILKRTSHITVIVGTKDDKGGNR